MAKFIDRTEDHVHIPTPGDHYSPTTGSAIPTIIYEIARCHVKAGGRTRVIVGKDTRKERYPVGECIEVPYGGVQYPRWQKLFDTLSGRLGLPRHFGASIYGPAAKALSGDFAGVIFVHNNPVAVPLLRRKYPRAILCLWANNELFRLYTNRELVATIAVLDQMICCSQYIADEINKRLPALLQSKVGVVRNGVDTYRFSPAGSPDRDLSADPILLFIGRIVPEKGVDLLLKAAIIAKARGLRFKLRIVGSNNFSAEDTLTPFERELRSLAAQLDDYIEFRPFADRAQVVQQYRFGSVFCVPSNWDDPCPLTVGEGMACGLPMIVSRRGGVPELGGNSVLYFDPPNVSQLADQIEKLICSAEARSHWGVRARERALEIQWENQYQALCRILENKR